MTVISTRNRKNIYLGVSKRQAHRERRSVYPTWKNGRRRRKEGKTKRATEIFGGCTVSPSTMGKIFSLMNQDEYTPVPITLEPRSPYFALLDFCHFKANELPERQGRNRRKRETERGWPAVRGLLRGHPRSMLNLVPSRLSLIRSNKARDEEARRRDKPDN